MSRTLGCILLLLCTGLAWPQQKFELIRQHVIENANWQIFQSENLTRSKYKGRWVYELREQTHNDPRNSDLFLDFEGSIRELDNYRVIHADYEKNANTSQGGSFSGKFYFSQHYLSLLPQPTSIFAPGNVPGSFTIEFWLYVYQPFDYQYVLDYTGSNPTDTSDRNTYGMSVFIKDRRLHFQFQNFFWNLEQEPFSWSISESDKIALHRWEHHAVSFNIMTGKLTTYKNGIEQDVKWVTADGRILSPIFNPLIQDELSTPMIIGRNAYFSVDDLKISRSSQDSFSLEKFVTQPAWLSTRIYKISENISRLKKLSFEVEKPEFAYMKYAYRVSDQYFLPDDDQLEWVYVQNGVENFPEAHRDGKYIQYKVMMYPHQDSLGPLRLSAIRLDYTQDDSPEAPVFLSALPGSREVTLSWIPSIEEDVIGYEIYYGTRQQDYICDHSSLGPSPVFVPFKQKGKLTAIQHTLSGLRNETPYFISIRSIDARGNRSAYSREIYVRPSTVYNQEQFSVGE